MLSHKCFLKGGFHDGADQTWLSDLYHFQREALYIFKMLLSGSNDFHSALLDASAKDPNVSAEQVLQLPKFKSLVNLDHLMEVKAHPGQTCASVLLVPELRYLSRLSRPTAGRG